MGRSYNLHLLILVLTQAIDPGQSASHTTTTATTEKPKNTNEAEAVEFLGVLSMNLSIACNRRVSGEWTYECNMTDMNKKAAEKTIGEYTKTHRAFWTDLNGFNWSGFSEESVKREFKIFSVLGMNALTSDKLQKYHKTKRAMEETYSTAKICTMADKNKFGDKCNKTLGLDQNLVELMGKSRDAKELRYLWTEWRKETGGKMRGDFTDLVTLFNEAAKQNKFSDASEFVINPYETSNFKEEVAKLWRQLEPFYRQLHAWTRFNLRKFYSKQNITIAKNGMIPADSLGNMWGQSWSNLIDLTLPHPNKPRVDLSTKFKTIFKTPTDMAQKAEEFFVSLSLPPMGEDFWKNSIFEHPNDGRNINCHPSAFDFCDGRDFRVKMCGQVDLENFLTICHEMGHSHYQMSYAHLPKVFRDGANPAFHEAVGDLIGLSVTTPSYLHSIGVLESEVTDPETELNAFNRNFNDLLILLILIILLHISLDLMMVALDKIAFLPFGYLVDLWRWNVLKGNTTKDNYNCDWWKLREEIQGLTPPDQRNEKQFDPGAKFHIASNTQYIGYFLSTIIQFQFHRSLCLEAGKYDPTNVLEKPLHKCNIFGHPGAGTRLKNMLQLGYSQSWPRAMEVLTGEKVMNASAILDYFQPLILWLEKTNKANNESVGWERPKNPSCKSDGKSAGNTLTSILFLTISTTYLALLFKQNN